MSYFPLCFLNLTATLRHVLISFNKGPLVLWDPPRFCRPLSAETLHTDQCFPQFALLIPWMNRDVRTCCPCAVKNHFGGAPDVNVQFTSSSRTPNCKKVFVCMQHRIVYAHDCYSFTRKNTAAAYLNELLADTNIDQNRRIAFMVLPSYKVRLNYWH